MTLASWMGDWVLGDWVLGEWELLDPWFLLVAPLAWVVLRWRLAQPRAGLPSASTSLLAGLPRTLRSRCATWLLPTLLALSVSVLAFALARPVTRDVVPVQSEGVDILLALDQSSSMDATDMAAGAGGVLRRVDVARECALAFAKARTTDRVGLLTFARFADLRCPPTLDMEALGAFLRSVETVSRDSEENATAIGLAVAQAADHFQDADVASKILILLTDGEESAFEILPEDGAKLAADAGIRVYAIGIGQATVHPLFGEREPDFSALEQIAEVTDGRFFRARSGQDLVNVYREIDKLETREIEDPRFRITDWFVVPLYIGLGIALLGMLLELFWIRGCP